MSDKWHTPYLGNVIGWVLSKTFYRPTRVNRLGRIVYVETKKLIPAWAIGQTWGEYVFLREPLLYVPLLCDHEGVHVRQWRECGWFGFGFAVAYLWELVVHGYDGNSFEKEARGGEA